VQVILEFLPEWIHPFTGLKPAQFRRLVRLVAQRGGDAIADGRPGRPWVLTLPDRMLLVAAYWRTNLTMRQIGPPFGVSHPAAHRVIDTLGPLLALAPVRRRLVDQVAIVDGTLIPTREHRLAAPSKNTGTRPTCRWPSTRTPAWSWLWRSAAGQPQRHPRVPLQRHQRQARRPAGRPAMADGAHRGKPDVVIPYRKPDDGTALPQWKEDLNAVHRRVRARVEHTLARMQEWKILRDYRRAASTLTDTASASPTCTTSSSRSEQTALPAKDSTELRDIP
jgi:hypothetical protein